MNWTCHICDKLATPSNALLIAGKRIAHRGCAGQGRDDDDRYGYWVGER